MPEYGFYSQRMCNNLMNEFTGERCALEDGHAGQHRSKRLFAQLYPDTTVEERRSS